MMKFAASLTVTGLIGFLILEALKIVLAPVAGWLIGILAMVLKFVLIVAGAGIALLGIGLFVGVSIWAYKRFRRTPAEATE